MIGAACLCLELDRRIIEYFRRPLMFLDVSCFLMSFLF